MSYLILCKEQQVLVKLIILTLHVLKYLCQIKIGLRRESTDLVSDSLGKNVFVERASEVALQQLLVVDGLGDDSANEPEVLEMVGVDVGDIIDGVGHSVPRAGLEQGVVGVEDLP